MRLIEMIESPVFRVLSYIERPGFAITVGKELCAAGLRSLDLPPEVLDVHILADGDDPGEATACDAALRWKLEGYRVLIARPPEGVGRARPNEGRAA